MKTIKEYFIHFAVMAIGFGALEFLFDLCTDDGKGFVHYLLIGAAFGILSTIVKYLEEKGWNRWKKLFGKKINNES